VPNTHLLFFNSGQQRHRGHIYESFTQGDGSLNDSDLNTKLKINKSSTIDNGNIFVSKDYIVGEGSRAKKQSQQKVSLGFKSQTLSRPLKKDSRVIKTQKQEWSGNNIRLMKGTPPISPKDRSYR